MTESGKNVFQDEIGTVDTVDELLIHIDGNPRIPDKAQDQIVVNGFHGNESPISDPDE